MSRNYLKIPIPALALLAAMSTVAPAGAAVFLPTTTSDAGDGACDGDCTLRDAVLAANQANGFDVIVLGPGTYQLGGAAGENLAASGDLDILDDLAIVGASAESTILVGSTDRVLEVHAGAQAEIIGVTIRGGQVSGDGGGIRNAGQLSLSRVLVTANRANSGAGGGIYSNGAGATLTVTQSAVTANSASGVGGGIAVGQQMTLSDSTVSGNSAGATGGGIHAFENADAPILGSTITANQAGTQGGGLFAESTPFITVDRPDLHNTILAGNTAPADRDCGGTPSSSGHNLIGVGSSTCIDFTAAKGDLVGTATAPRDPRLGPLANNGGTTPTHALLAGSPAINAGEGCTATDQRGQGRASACDIGAFEISTDCLTGGPTLCLNDERFKVTVAWRTPRGVTGQGQAVQLTSDTGYFWFFDPANVELTIKVLNGCALTNRFWVFVSGLTNVEVTVTVTDTATGQVKVYTNPQGRTFRAVLDTGAFATCG
jgi:hypothetical protein